MRVIIAGGGIEGLGVAIALGRAGHRVVVPQRTARPRPGRRQRARRRARRPGNRPWAEKMYRAARIVTTSDTRYGIPRAAVSTQTSATRSTEIKTLTMGCGSATRTIPLCGCRSLFRASARRGVGCPPERSTGRYAHLGRNAPTFSSRSSGTTSNASGPGAASCSWAARAARLGGGARTSRYRLPSDSGSGSSPIGIGLRWASSSGTASAGGLERCAADRALIRGGHATHARPRPPTRHRSF